MAPVFEMGVGKSNHLDIMYIHSWVLNLLHINSNYTVIVKGNRERFGGPSVQGGGGESHLLDMCIHSQDNFNLLCINNNYTVTALCT